MDDIDLRSVSVTWSHLKQMSMSPAHYRSSIVEPREETPAMRTGRLVHTLILGGPPFLVYEGERRGKAWTEFKEANEGVEIVTVAECSRATRAREAVMKNRLAVELLEGEREVPLKWKTLGRACSTRGVDVVGSRWLTELKTSTTSAPWKFTHQALRMLYHGQCAWYQDALRQHGHNAEAAYVVAVEMSPPFAVTTFELTTKALMEGRKLVRAWMERLLACEASNEWPEYVQTTQPLDVPDDLELTFGDAEGEEAA